MVDMGGGSPYESPMIRIIGGAWRGRRIATPKGDATRPAANAHRESVMNILGPRLEGARVLDVFAGSGAFGLECLSRGAALAVFVERARPSLVPWQARGIAACSLVLWFTVAAAGRWIGFS